MAGNPRKRARAEEMFWLRMEDMRRRGLLDDPGGRWCMSESRLEDLRRVEGVDGQWMPGGVSVVPGETAEEIFSFLPEELKKPERSEFEDGGFNESPDPFPFRELWKGDVALRVVLQARCGNDLVMCSRMNGIGRDRLRQWVEAGSSHLERDDLSRHCLARFVLHIAEAEALVQMWMQGQVIKAAAIDWRAAAAWLKTKNPDVWGEQMRSGGAIQRNRALTIADRDRALLEDGNGS